MRTHSDSIIDIYSLNTSEGKKNLVLENVLSKLEIKSYSIINDFGKRTFETEVQIHISRKDFKFLDIKDIETTIFQIHRKRLNKLETNEWYQVTAPRIFETNSNTIIFKGSRVSESTDTNNFGGFNII